MIVIYSIGQFLVIIMSFFAKGDFKIEDSWETAKKPTSRTGSRSSKRDESKPQSLMMQLAASYAEPTTDIIDDSLSRLLMKERGAIPTPAKKEPVLKKPPQPQSRSKKETDEDKDLLASMASRLQKLEKTNQAQRLELKEQRDQIEKIKTQNAFLKAMKQDASKVYSDMSQLKQHNSELQAKVQQMEAYLQQYGLKWVGNKVQGSLDADKMKKDIKDAKHAYRLPSEIDLSTIQRRVADLNAGLQEEGFGTEIYNEKGVHKFRKTEYLPIAFYSNGIAIKGYNFYSYKSKESLRILADLVDGYFPFVFKGKYPNGVLLQVVDKVEETYVQQKKQTSINTFQSHEDKDFQPQSKEQFLNKLPKQVVKNGKIIPIREEFQKMFDPSFAHKQEKKSAGESSGHVEQIEGTLVVKSPCYHKIQAQELTDDQACILKVRDEVGNVYMLKMFKDSKIIDVVIQIRKVVRGQFRLMSNYPRRSYDALEQQNLQQLGFYPNINLHLQK